MTQETTTQKTSNPLSRLSLLAQEELMNIAFIKGHAYVEAMLEEIEIMRVPSVLTSKEIEGIDRFVSMHYKIDMKDYEERLRINQEYGLEYKAAVNMARRFAKRYFDPNFELLENK